MLAVVLAAGRGTRLGSLTDERSKGMMPIAGRPMVERVMAMLAQGGVERLIVVAHPDDHALTEHLQRSRWADRVRLAYQEQRLGMAHAVECAAPLVREEDVPAFILASCDNLYPEGHVAALIARRREQELDAALTLMWIPRQQAPATGVVVLKNERVTKIIEKPRPEQIPSYNKPSQALAAPSLYALTTPVLDYLSHVRPSSRGEREFPDVLRLLIEDGGAVGGQLVEDRMTLTRPEDLLAINFHFLRHDPACATVEANLPHDVTLAQPVRIEADVQVSAGCRIGPEVYLEAGCRIGAGTRLRRAVVLRGARVDGGTIVAGSVVA